MYSNTLETLFLFFPQKMITFVPCNIFERIWYSEFILEKKSLKGDNEIHDFGEQRSYLCRKIA